MVARTLTVARKELLHILLIAAARFKKCLE